MCQRRYVRTFRYKERACNVLDLGDRYALREKPRLKARGTESPEKGNNMHVAIVFFY